MSFADRFFKGLRKYLTEQGVLFAEGEHIVDTYEEDDNLCCVVKNRRTKDYRVVTVHMTLADAVSHGKIGERM